MIDQACLLACGPGDMGGQIMPTLYWCPHQVLKACGQYRVGIICPPGWDRVNVAVKNWCGQVPLSTWPQAHLNSDTLAASKYASWKKEYSFSNYLIPLWYNRFAVNFEESFHCAFWVLGMARRTSKHYSMYNLLVISSNPTIFPLEKYQFCDVFKTFSINILQRKWFYIFLT